MIVTETYIVETISAAQVFSFDLGASIFDKEALGEDCIEERIQLVLITRLTKRLMCYYPVGFLKPDGTSYTTYDCYTDAQGKQLIGLINSIIGFN